MQPTTGLNPGASGSGDQHFFIHLLGFGLVFVNCYYWVRRARFYRARGSLNAVLECRNIVKRYGGVRALDGATLSVERGSVVGLVGPNGAGKTTLLKVALGILRRDSGVVRLMGRDPLLDAEAREDVGVVFERPSLPSSIPVSRVLEYAARMKGAGRGEVRRVVRLAGLEGHEWKPFSSLSAGLKQRAAIAHALIGGPSLVIADEPTSNLDPVERVRVLNLIGELNRDYGITFVVSSHVLPEVVRVATSIALMIGGRVVRVGAPEEVLGGLRVSRVRSSDPDRLLEHLRRLGFDAMAEGVNVVVYLDGLESHRALFEALSGAVARGLVVYSVDFVEASIEAEMRSEAR